MTDRQAKNAAIFAARKEALLAKIVTLAMEVASFGADERADWTHIGSLSEVAEKVDYSIAFLTDTLDPPEPK